MLNFCTLFDSNYLSRGIAMYESLKKHCGDFHLYIFAFDEQSMAILKKLNLEKATVISLKEFENEELLRLKPGRSKAEYCWTCTPATILYIIEKYNVNMCTYLDADIFFFSSPKALLDELQPGSVMITSHRYTEKYDASVPFGKYCVQFMVFKNNDPGLKVLHWWRDRCYEWCYARQEEGKFGDQKYLDDWPERFPGIHELEHLGGGLAPWNIQQYEIYQKNDRVYGREKKTNKEFEAVFYHFQGLKFYSNGKIELGWCELTENIRNIIYKPYIKTLEDIKYKINNMNDSFDPHGTIKEPKSWRTIPGYFRRLLNKSFNLYNKDKFLRN
jgi:hypothetical protein